MDVDTVLLSVRERDSWRRRMEILEKSLAEVREERLELETRLRRLRKELAKLRFVSNAILERTGTRPRGGEHAPRSVQFPSR